MVRIGPQAGRPPIATLMAALFVAGGLVITRAGLDRIPIGLCPLKSATGWPCMTCGSTRALGRLFALDLTGALSLNPLVALSALAVVLWGLVDAVLRVRGRALPLVLSGARLRIVGAVLGAAVLLNWAYLVAAGR